MSAAGPAPLEPTGESEARERLLDAVLDAVLAEGYEAATIEAICERAGVQRAEFDAHFDDLEDCALALVDRFWPPAREQLVAAFEAEERWPDSLRAASYAVCDWLVEYPREARFGAIELLKAGERAHLRWEATFKEFAPMIDAGRAESPDPEAMPELIGERAMGSLALMLTKRLRRGPVDPYAMVPQLMYAAVLPYLGEEAAQRELEIPPPPRPEERGS